MKKSKSLKVYMRHKTMMKCWDQCLRYLWEPFLILEKKKVLMLYDDNLFSLVSNLLSLRQMDLCLDLQFILKVDKKEHYVLLTRCWPSTWD